MKILAVAALAIIALGVVFNSPSIGQAHVGTPDGFPIGVNSNGGFFVVKRDGAWKGCAVSNEGTVNCGSVY